MVGVSRRDEEAWQVKPCTGVKKPRGPDLTPPIWVNTCLGV
ncbi:MAG: hypothetical protein OWQ48_04365 [Desulfurococcus sp.]|nr:hypothetical protein [Desulfurococcus sp.]